MADILDDTLDLRDDLEDYNHDSYTDEDEPYGLYTGEEIKILFTGRAVKSDYGVPGSPVWTEVEDPSIDQLHILEVKVDPKILPKELQDNLLKLADEVDWS